MLSALYNFSISDSWEAYGGAGLGIVKVDVQHTGSGFAAGNDYSGSDNVFGWQLIGGARVRLFNGPIRMFVEYRTRRDADDGHTVQYNSSSFQLGARWTF
jgi:opacity protein-like surface antigen